MNDRELDRLLSALPRERASAGFQARVLVRTDTTTQTRRWAPTLAWGLATAALLAVVVGTVSWRQSVQERREEIARNRIDSLRIEYLDLEREMRHLRRLVAASEPVVGVEGSGEYDYVFDLEEITRARGGDAFPVSYRLPE